MFKSMLSKEFNMKKRKLGLGAQASKFETRLKHTAGSWTREPSSLDSNHHGSDSAPVPL